MLTQRAISILLALALPAAMPAQTVFSGFAGIVAQFPAADRYNVVYTGRLFGFFRLPGVQTSADRGCPAAMDAAREPEAAEFDRTMRSIPKRNETVVRVAMGDNLAPFFLSRKMVLIPKTYNMGTMYRGDPPKEINDKAAFEYNRFVGEWWWDGAQVPGYLDGNGQLPMDNVACFLSAMGFDAVVPGVHDFYYGPERLREVARFLGTKNTRMLGANLYIQARLVNSSQTAGRQAGTDGVMQKGKRGQTAGRASDPSQPILVVPTVALPWMRAITVKNARNGKDPLVDEVCILGAPGNGWEAKGPQASDCATGGVHLKTPATSSNGVDFWMDPTAEPLNPGRYAVFALKKGEEVDLKAMNVQFPFFEYPASSRTNPKLSDMKPWALTGGELGAERVAIFGVVSSTLLQGVGQLNSMWLYADGTSSVDDRREVDVQVSDPAEALKQVFQYCQQVNECRDARKLLLAQMPQQEVYDVTAHVPLPELANPIDLALAEADPDRPSEERKLERNLQHDLQGPASAKPVVLVPGPHSRLDPNAPYVLQPTLQAAEIRPSYDEGGVKKQSVENKIYRHAAVQFNLFPNQLPSVSGDRTLADYLAIPQQRPAGAEAGYDTFFRESVFQKGGAMTNADLQRGVEQIALYAMQRACHADIAILQHRSVVLPQKLPPTFSQEGFEQLISAIFWEGDFVLCKQLSGDTLNALLRQSQQYQNDEDNGLAPESMKGNSLATLGADQAATDETKRLVNGQLIDPKRLYSVAIPDFLVGGATGYSMLQGSDQPPMTPWSKMVMRPLADLVARTVTQRTSRPKGNTTTGTDALDWAMLNSQVPGGTSFMKPEKLKQPAFLDWFHDFIFDHKKVNFACRYDKREKVRVGDGCPEELAQERPLWWVGLYKADLSYSQFLHGYSETAVAQQFPGVTQVSLTSAEYKSIAADYILRAERDSWHFMEYVQSTLNYGDRLQRTIMPSNGSAQPNEPYVPSQTADYWYQEAGIGYRITPTEEGPAGLKLVLAAGFETQPAAPFTQFSTSQYLPPGTQAGGGGASPVVLARRTLDPSGRLGFRYDFLYPKTATTPAGGAGGGTSTGAGGAAAAGGGGGSGKKGGGGQNQATATGQGQGQGGGQGGGGQGTAQTFNTYLEAGFEKGALFRGVSEYQFEYANAANGSPAECLVDNVTCLQAVAAAKGTLASVVANRNHEQQGFYFNFRIDGPLPLVSGSEFVLENRGDWFQPHRDLSIDTRLDSDFKVSLMVPVWRKINLSPSVEMILFQTQVTRNFYHSYTTSVSLNYSFEWHPGIGFLRSLVYNNPVPTQPTLPAK
jgi:hypothetical protein